MIPGEIAFKCLQSVPLHKDEALGVTGSTLPYVEFQSGETPVMCKEGCTCAYIEQICPSRKHLQLATHTQGLI